MTGDRHGVQRVAMVSVHTSPLARLGGKKAGGMNAYIRDCSQEMGRRGIEVDIYTRKDAPGNPDVVTLRDHVRVFYIDAGPPRFLSSAEIYSHLTPFAAQVISHAGRRSAHYDVIFSHYWLSGWVAHTLRARWGIPVIQMFHTLGRMKERVAQGGVQEGAGVRAFTEIDVMSWADCLIAATPAERAQMLWLYRADRRKVRVIPPGVDLERF